MSKVDSDLRRTAWHRGVAIGDGSTIRVVAMMGACPLVRVDVDERPHAVIVSLFERLPAEARTDEDVAIAAVGIVVTVDVPISAPLNDRTLIDGATGREPERLPATDPDRDAALSMDIGGGGVLVPVGREFSWVELTGTPWFDRPAERCSPQLDGGPEVVAFFTPSSDMEPRPRKVQMHGKRDR
jgi:hypothetical protein